MKNLRNLIASLLITATITIGLSSSVFAGFPVSNMNTNVLVSENDYKPFSFKESFRVEKKGVKWHKFYFYKGEFVDVDLSGDGSTDLDIYFCDGNGKPLASALGKTDEEALEMIINKSGLFWVKVVNRGKANNDYALMVETE